MVMKMNLKNIFFVLLLLILCVGCASAISAVSDQNIDDDVLNVQEEDVSLESVEENVKEDVFASQEQDTLKQTNDSVVADTASELSPYQQFVKDIEENHGTVYLKGDIKISKSFLLKEKITIDGQGHTIDAQHKTRIFEVRNSLTLKNMVLINGKADLGGAIFCKGHLTIDNCKFKNNLATESGGAIGVTYGMLTIRNSVFEKNTVKNSKSSGYGGAIWTLKSNSDISKSTFKSNKCISTKLKKHSQATKYKFNGGAISYSQGSSHKLTDCKFYNNKASNHGGSIFVHKSKSLKINRCEFTKNRAGFEDGGAISFSGKKMTISNSNFKNNLAYEDGGAIDSYSLTGSKLYITVKNTKFTSNTAYKCGGAIWMGVKTNYNVVNSKFAKNKASSAGAVEAEDGISKFTKCTFTSNKAAKITSWVVKTKSGGRLAHSGGAILVKNKCKITKCTFKGNKAKWGKVVKIEGGKVTAKKNKGYKAN